MKFNSPLPHPSLAMLEQSGIEWFHFALFPEGPEMQAYFRRPQTTLTHFTSPEVASERSAERLLAELIEQVHPEDQAVVAGFFQCHVGDHTAADFRSDRFRALNAAGAWRWYEVRSRVRMVGEVLILIFIIR